MFNKICVAVAIGLLTGCASAPVKEEPGYDSTSSHALNVWRASGMSGGMKDTKVPKEEVGNFWDSGSGQLLGIYSDMRMADFGGLDSNFVGGVGLALALLGPDEPPQRNSVFYWMDKNGLDETSAMRKMTETFMDAGKRGLEGIGVEVIGGKLGPKVTEIKQGFSTSLFVKIPGSKHCKETKVGNEILETPCYVSLYQPKKSIKSDDGNKILGIGESWYQSAEDKAYYSEIKFKVFSYDNKLDADEAYKDVDQIEIIRAISKEMPKNFFVYLAPNRINGKDGGKLKQPLIVDKGNIFSFISAKE